MNISCCVWGLPVAEADAVGQLQGIGFERIDVRPFVFEQPVPQQALARPGLDVNCLAASFGMPEGAGLDQDDWMARTGAVAYTVRAIEQAARLGARDVYLVPGTDASESAQARYAAVLGPLAQKAQDQGIRLSLEHFPGLALPTVAAMRAFVDDIDHPNLHVLVDIGHAQIEGISPAQAIEIAGERLGYVHLNDNDGEGDLHWGLLDGMLTEDALGAVATALRDVGYEGPVSLELSAGLEDPVQALSASLELSQRIFGSA